MKVLITDIHHGNGGGHVTYVLSLLREMADRCEFTLAAPPTGRLFREASRLPNVRVLPGLYTSRVFSAVPEILRLRRFLKAERFDIAHCNGGADHRHLMAASLGLREAPAIVWTKHNTNEVDSFGHRLRARFGTDLCIAVSDYVSAQLADSFYRSCAVERIYHGLDLNHYRQASIAEKRKARVQCFGSELDDCIVFGSVGGTDIEKGWMLLVQAVSRLKPELKHRIRIVVAGDPPRPEIEERVAQLGCADVVVFPGLVKDVRTVLTACDVGFVLSYKESASYACYESLALGLPVLVSNAGGLPESIEHMREGWMVPVGDIDAVEQQVKAILTNKFCLKTFGARARVRAEQRFDVRRFALDTLNAYVKARAI
ncbi:glycosyltransferase family 4 protein [Alcaligenes sp. WGS1538]|uniref:glycosyltransferase family 4 protein n=1 Tax=Alcaligenes sp. WGS1538 TaxID=3366811 RepID=UPI00372D078E